MISTLIFSRSCLRALGQGGYRWKTDRPFFNLFFHCALELVSGREEETQVSACWKDVDDTYSAVTYRRRPGEIHFRQVLTRSRSCCP